MFMLFWNYFIVVFFMSGSLDSYVSCIYSPSSSVGFINTNSNTVSSEWIGLSSLKHGAFLTLPIFFFVLFFLARPLFMKAFAMKYGFLLSLIFINYIFMSDYFLKKILYDEASIYTLIEDFVQKHQLLIYGSIGYYLIYTYSKLVRNVGDYSLSDILLPWERPLGGGIVFPNDIINSPDVISASLFASKDYFLDILVFPFVLFYITWTIWVYYRAKANETDLFSREFLPISEHSNPLLVLLLVLVLQILICMMTLWFPLWDAYLRYTPVAQLRNANVIFIISRSHKDPIAFYPIQKGSQNNYYVEFQNQRYFYDKTGGQFLLPTLPENLHLNDYINGKGCSSEEARLKTTMYGQNILQVPIPAPIQSLIESINTPVFVFQVFTISLNLLNELFYAPFVALFILILAQFYNTQKRLSHLSDINAQVRASERFRVLRDAKWVELGASDLVPGDKIRISLADNSFFFHFDAIMTSGSIRVSESVITGESVAQIKEGLSCLEDKDRAFNVREDSDRHVLFAGSKFLSIISSSMKPGLPVVEAYILRTGYRTTQGEVLNSLLYRVDGTPPVIQTQSFWFMFSISIVSITAAIFTWIYKIGNLFSSSEASYNKKAFHLFIKCLLMTFTAVPDSLTLINSYIESATTAQLKEKGFLIGDSASRIASYGGLIDVACFDKTGTLTEENLKVSGVVFPENLSQIEKRLKEVDTPIALVMASCHSFTMSSEKASGDPMEHAALEYLSYKLISRDVVHSADKNINIEILKRQEFTTKLRKMSVLATCTSRSLGSPPSGKLFLATKGAPDAMEELFRNVPLDYTDTYTKLTNKGYRVLALGYCEFDVKQKEEVLNAPWDEFYHKRELEFQGFLLFDCRCKPDSKAVLQDLIRSRIKVVMITGDLAFTALFVARQLEVVDHSIALIDRDKKTDQIVVQQWLEGQDEPQNELFEVGQFFQRISKISEFPIAPTSYAITGSAFQALVSQNKALFVARLLPLISVYAQFTTELKEYVVILYSEAGIIVLMCGDGANDLLALKKSHIGISLFNRPIQHGDSSDLFVKASLGSLMISTSGSISAVIVVIKQGRCALATFIQVLKILLASSLFKIIYSVIQVLYDLPVLESHVILFDLLLAIFFILFLNSKPADKITPERPFPSVFNAYSIFSSIGQCFIHLWALLGIFSLVKKYASPFDLDKSLQKTTLSTAFYYLSFSVRLTFYTVNYQGEPYQLPMYRYKSYMILLLFFIVSITLLLSEKCLYFNFTMFNLASLTSELRNELVILMIADFVLCYGLEVFSLKVFGKGSENPKRLFKYPAKKLAT